MIQTWSCSSNSKHITNIIPIFKIASEGLCRCTAIVFDSDALDHRWLLSIYTSSQCELPTLVALSFRLRSDRVRRARAAAGRPQVARKLAMVEADLERAEERAETGES